MARTLRTFLPWEGHARGSAYARVRENDAYQHRPVVIFSDAADTERIWTFTAPRGLVRDKLAVVVSSYMVTGYSAGTIAWTVYLEAVRPQDEYATLEGDNWVNWSAANSSGAVAVGAYAGQLQQIPVRLSEAWMILPGDYCRLRLVRDTALGTATGDVALLAVELLEVDDEAALQSNAWVWADGDVETP